jgi:hypothetical protein
VCKDRSTQVCLCTAKEVGSAPPSLCAAAASELALEDPEAAREEKQKQRAAQWGSNAGNGDGARNVLVGAAAGHCEPGRGR